MIVIGRSAILISLPTMLESLLKRVCQSSIADDGDGVRREAPDVAVLKDPSERRHGRPSTEKKLSLT